MTYVGLGVVLSQTAAALGTVSVRFSEYWVQFRFVLVNSCLSGREPWYGTQQCKSLSSLERSCFRTAPVTPIAIAPPPSYLVLKRSTETKNLSKEISEC